MSYLNIHAITHSLVMLPLINVFDERAQSSLRYHSKLFSLLLVSLLGLSQIFSLIEILFYGVLY
jgi:hypothetical protein